MTPEETINLNHSLQMAIEPGGDFVPIYASDLQWAVALANRAVEQGLIHKWEIHSKRDSQVAIVTPLIRIKMAISIRNVEDNNFALALCVALWDALQKPRPND